MCIVKYGFVFLAVSMVVMTITLDIHLASYAYTPHFWNDWAFDLTMAWVLVTLHLCAVTMGFVAQSAWEV